MKNVIELIDKMIIEREGCKTTKPVIKGTEITLLKLLKMEIEKMKSETAKAVGHDLRVMRKIKKGGSGQPMKDFEKKFYFNWKTKFLEDEMSLFYRVRNWIGEWCEENIENFTV